MDLDAGIVFKALFRLLNHYPECGHNSKTLIKLAEDYWEDFESEGLLTVEQLKPSISLARRSSKFYPKSSDIIKAYKELKAKGRVAKPLMQIEQKSTWHDPLPHETELNKKRISILADVVCKKITKEEGEEKQKLLLRNGESAI